MAPVEEKPYFFSKDANDTTSHILPSTDLMVPGVGMKKSSFHRGRFSCTRLHIYQNKRPDLYSNGSRFPRVSLSFHAGLNKTFSLMENGNAFRFLKACFGAEGEMNRIKNVQDCDSDMQLLRFALKCIDIPTASSPSLASFSRHL